MPWLRLAATRRTAPASASPSGEADLGLVDALAQLSFAVQGALTRVAAAHDASIIQTRLLGILRDRHPTITELAAFLQLDKSSVTGLVDRAEERGLVRRVASAARPPQCAGDHHTRRTGTLRPGAG